MYQRKESTTRLVLDDGSATDFKFVDGLLIEDIMLQHAHATGYSIVLGVDSPAKIGRDIKDYLIKLYTLN